ncbi:MMPL family transporter [Azospirillum brasilense]|uniref:MMPL family transporter n=1 Tax=Azospirillum argentinense TaxID=2970906 RepID=UPI00190E6AE7|nr:MMPL family transporter [Azospirillum argentinense]MBK3803003.1 MMPL family transporter [Azospirillum argentinense]
MTEKQGVLDRMADFGRAMIGGLGTLSCQWPGVTLALGVLLSVLAGWYSAENLTMSTSTADMISSQAAYRQHTEEYRQAFSFSDDQIVVVVDSPSPDQSDAAAVRLAELMSARTDVLSAVEVPSTDPYFRQYGLLFLDTEKLQDLATRLANAQAALGALNAAPNLQGLADLLDLILTHVDEGAPASPADLLNRLAVSTATVIDGQPAPLSWTGLVQAAEEEDRAANRRFVLARPVLDNSSFGRGRPPVNATREAIAAVQAEPVGQGVEMRVTGTVPLRQTELDTVANSAGLATILSFILVSAVLIAGMRSGRLIACIMVVLLLGLTLSAGAAALTVGRLNLISVTCAVMFFGLGDDYGGHLGLRYQEELRRGLPPRAAAIEAVRAVGPALVLSTLCAIIGFLSFVPTAYLGLAEFGIISALGMAVALFISLTLLPALIVLLRPGPGVPQPEREDRGFAGWVTRRHRAILALAGASAVLSVAALPLVRLDVNPLNLQDERTEAVATYRDLAAVPRTSPYSVNVLTPNLEAAQALADRLRALPESGGVRTFASFIPKDQEAKLPILADMSLLLGPSLTAPAASAALDQDGLERAFDMLKTVLGSYLSEKPTGPNDLRAAVQRFADALARVQPAQLATLDRALTGGVPPLLDRLREGMAVEQPVTAADVPDSLKARWIAADGRARVEVLPTHDISDSRDMAEFADAVLAVAPNATGAPVTVTEGARVVSSAFLEATALTLVLMVLLLVAVQRSVTGMVLILAPLVLAALWTMATAGLLDIPFNFANVIVIPLLFALGVSSSIHMVSRGQDLVREGASDSAFGIELLVTSTPRAVLISTLTTSTAFATLALSNHRGLSSMGVLLAVSITYTVISSLVVLPALMILWHRWRLRRRPAAPVRSPTR